LPHKNNVCLLAKQSAYIHGASLRAGKTSLPGEIKGRLLKIFYTQKQKNIGRKVRTQLCRPKHSGGRYLCNSFAKNCYVLLR
jgi:hypothetical protein